MRIKSHVTINFLVLLIFLILNRLISFDNIYTPEKENAFYAEQSRVKISHQR